MSSAMAERRCKDFRYQGTRSLERRRGDDLWRLHGEQCSAFEKNFEIPFSVALQTALQGLRSIAIDSDVLSGTPRIAGTRIPVYMVIDAIKYYGTVDGVLKSYPDLTSQQIQDALSFAGAVLEHPVEYEPENFA
jgi:uncharacterized protein (DUF433 family)